jgi:hypothetical protein
VDRQWHSICSSGPVAPGEYEYLTSASLNSLGTTLGLAGVPGQFTKEPAFLLIAFTGTAGNTFDFEYYQNWEFIGSGIDGKVLSEVDEVGLSTTMGALRNHNDGQIDKSHPIYKSPAIAQKLVENYAARSTSGWVSTVGGVAQAAGGALLAAPNPLAQIAGAALSIGGSVFSKLFGS